MTQSLDLKPGALAGQGPNPLQAEIGFHHKFEIWEVHFIQLEKFLHTSLLRFSPQVSLMTCLVSKLSAELSTPINTLNS